MNLQKAIFRTLAYSDVFDYPLTPRELYQFLIVDQPVEDSFFRESLSKIKNNQLGIETKGKFWFLKGRGKLVALRKRREIWSQKKIKIAQKTIRWLKLVPWVRMIAITGALAMKNSKPGDDIDLLIITAGNRLWLCRGMIAVILRLLGSYRRPGKIKDMICPNLFLTENSFCLPEEERNLFTAHEVCQVKLLWDKDATYEKFLAANLWGKHFLANFFASDWSTRQNHQVKDDKNKDYLLDFLEVIAFRCQLFYMRKKKTVEKIEPERAFFHPRDLTDWVLGEYHQRLGQETQLPKNG